MKLKEWLNSGFLGIPIYMWIFAFILYFLYLILGFDY